METKLIRLNKVADLMNVSKSTVKRWVAVGQLPIAREIRRKGTKQGIKYVSEDDLSRLGQ